MKKGELKGLVKNELHAAVQNFIGNKVGVGELLTGAITVTAPGYFKAKVVDEDFKSYSFTITIQEGK